MANPARVKRQVIGVANAAFAERMVETLKSHGSVRSWVVHGGGLDELTTTGMSTVLELDNGEIRHHSVDPRELGLAQARNEDLSGGYPAENAEAVQRVLAGVEGPHRDIVVLNAGAGLVVAGTAATLAGGIELARESIDSGAAAMSLARFVEASQDAASADALGDA
jgi:anthranilate phosphoribosyltransferase